MKIIKLNRQSKTLAQPVQEDCSTKFVETAQEAADREIERRKRTASGHSPESAFRQACYKRHKLKVLQSSARRPLGFLMV
jgi:hypothetical protein